jgi:hypothetical protein
MPQRSQRSSIFFICIIASNARLATAGSGSVIAFVRATYSSTLRLRNGRLLSEDHEWPIDAAGTVTIRVSQALDEKNPITIGELVRRRFRLERYEKIPTRLDLKPEDPKPMPPYQDTWLQGSLIRGRSGSTN